VWTVPARRRRLSAVGADGVRLAILGVEDLRGRGGRDGRGGRRCSGRRRRSRGCGRRGRRSRGRGCGRAPRRLRRRTFLTYVAVVAAVVAGVPAASAAAGAGLAHHVDEELGSGESADLRGAEGLVEAWKRLLGNGPPLRLESLARVPGLALLLLAGNCAFLRLKLAQLW